ncbi:MAG: hypothetical protein JJE04_20115 [Acidobacteriia bacterium]|nr:hypothetical protein [Terriglobia bacterium]
MRDVILDSEVLLGQFNRLMQELLRGTMTRNCFRPWEIDILLDIESCNLRDANRRETLRRYQKAVQREAERGGNGLLKLSAYLERNRTKRAKISEQAAGSAV